MTDSVGEIERRRFVLSINRDRFFEERFGDFVAARIMMNVGHVPDGVREEKRIAALAADLGGLCVQCERGIAVSRIAFDLSESFQRFDQLARCAAMSIHRHRT